MFFPLFFFLLPSFSSYCTLAVVDACVFSIDLTRIPSFSDSCCCNHGGRCTCSHKREHPHLDTVPESDSEDEVSTKTSSTKCDVRSRRRADTSRSDGSILSFDTNGHHKPTHKLIKTSQKAAPYTLSRTNSLHNRSADNLSGMSYSTSPTDMYSSGSRDAAGRARRKSKSATGSPLMAPTSLAQLNGQLPPLDLSGIEYPPYVPNSADFFGSLSDHEQPMFSAGLSTSVDWSHYDGLEFASKAADFAPSNYSQPQSFGGFDFSGSEQLASLTTNTSNSGEASEVEDFLPSALDEFDTNSAFHDSAPGSTLNLSSAQAQLLASSELPDLDFAELKFMKAADNKYLPTPAGDESAMLNPAAAGAYSLDASEFLWDMQGLPSMVESTEYWDQQ